MGVQPDAESGRQLAAIVTLLDQAARTIFDRGESVEPLQSLGLGVYLTQARFVALRGGGPAPDSDPVAGGGPRSATELLVAARQLIRPHLYGTADETTAAELAAELEDLIGEASRLGC